jgi:hypothetical protein
MDELEDELPADSEEQEATPETPEEAALEALGHSEKPEEQEAVEPEKEAQTPEAKAAEEEAKKAITDKDLEPLNSKSQSTNQRFQKLTDGFKEKSKQVEELTKENEYFKDSFAALNKLGFNDEAAGRDLVALAEYRNVVSSGDVEAFKASIANQIKNFEAMHGKRVSISASALDDVPELRAKVDSFEMDEDTALEIARSRMLEQRALQLQAEQESLMFNRQQQEQAVNSAISEVSALQESWAKTDPDFNAILPHLAKQIEEIGAKYPPNQWAHLIQMQYGSIKQALASASRPSREIYQPLRSNGGGSSRVAPTSPEQAALFAMGYEID